MSGAVVGVWLSSERGAELTFKKQFVCCRLSPHSDVPTMSPVRPLFPRKPTIELNAYFLSALIGLPGGELALGKASRLV